MPTGKVQTPAEQASLQQRAFEEQVPLMGVQARAGTAQVPSVHEPLQHRGSSEHASPPP